MLIEASSVIRIVTSLAILVVDSDMETSNEYFMEKKNFMLFLLDTCYLVTSSLNRWQILYISQSQKISN